MRFAYCSGSMACVVIKPLLPNGIKVLNIVNGTLTIQRSARNSTNNQAQPLKCEVHYSNHSVKHHVLKTNFMACIRTQRLADVNLTRALRDMLPWKQVVDIEIYNMNKTKVAYCNTKGCIKVNNSGYSAPVFWSRLQVEQDSLLLTGIVESDHELELKVIVHLNPDDTQVKSKRAAGIQTVRVYILKILVVSTQGNCYRYKVSCISFHLPFKVSSVI